MISQRIILLLTFQVSFHQNECMLAKYFNWTYYSEHYFLFIPTEMNSTQALAICSSYESNLLSVETDDRHNFIKLNYLNSTPNGIWLALYDFIGKFLC